MKRLATLIVVAGVAVVLTACQPSSDCGRVLTRDTTLQADVLNCPGDGLVVGADDIEIRLNGHTVDGTGAARSAGIRLAGHDDVVVQGSGRVTQFADGVRVANGLRNRVRNLTSTGNGFGIHLVDADVNRLVGNDASENRATGDFSSGFPYGGIILEGSDGNLVEDNELSQNAGGPGVALVDSSSNRVLDNVPRGSDDPNILLRRAHGNVVAGNGSTGSNVVAIELQASNDNLIEDNVAGDNESEGITVWQGSARNTVRSNTAASNENEGILVGDAAGTIVRGNVTSNNRSSADGIVVWASASGTVIRGNTSNGNGDDGIDVESPSTTIFDNTSNGNGDLGIEAVAGVADGGGNRATGNGNPAQCTGVVCS